MKPTQEEIDQLLSGYLDDALDATELNQVQRWLEHEPEIISRYQQLVEIRETVNALFKAPPSKRLAEDFSMKVLSAAVTRAHEEGVDESHPLMRVQEQPFTNLERQTVQVSTQRLIAVVLTLAACLLGLVLGFDLLSRQPSDSSFLLSQNLEPNIGTENSVDAESNRQFGEVAANPQGTASEVDSSPLISKPGVASPKHHSEDQFVQNGSPQRAIPLAQQDPAPVAAIADAGDASEDSSMKAGSALSASSKGAILVLNISRSEIGRTEQAVRNAMNESGIRGLNQVSLGRESIDQLVAQSNSNNDAVVGEPNDTSGVSVLLLQVSAKQFDQFYQSVWADQRGIETISMSVAFDAPILNLVDSIWRDPTSVKQEAMSLEFDEAVGKGLLVGQLQQIPAIPMNRSEGVSPPVLSAENDLQTQVLLLVR